MATPTGPPQTQVPFVEKIGIPRPLFWGFVGLLIFMIGDGVESNYLAVYIADNGYSDQIAGTTISVYGIAVAISSWLSGSLSTIWGPRRVMFVGAGIWVFFQVLFLTVGINSGNVVLLIATYGLRGFGYPLFAFAFLVWIQVTTRQEMRGRASGWFYFAYTGGLPTLGSAFAAITIGPVGAYNTLWLALGLVIVGGLVSCFAVREAIGSKPLAEVEKTAAARAKALFGGIDILWRYPKISLAAIVRMINTTPYFGFFVFLPFFFTREVGLRIEQYLIIITVMNVVAIGSDIVSGFLSDRIGWRRTIMLVGGLGCAFATLLIYYVPDNWPTFYAGLAVACVFGVTITGYIPLSALGPSMVPQEDKGNAMAALNLGAGVSAFLGPALYTVLNPFIGIQGVMIVYAGIYLLNGVLAYFLRHPSDPGEARRLAALEPEQVSAPEPTDPAR